MTDPQASLAVSAMQQLVAEATVPRDRPNDRLRQVDVAMPAIDILNPRADVTAATGSENGADRRAAAPVRPEAAAISRDPSPSEPEPSNVMAERTVVVPAQPFAEALSTAAGPETTANPSAEVSSQSGGVGAAIVRSAAAAVTAEPTSSEVRPDPTTVTQAVAPVALVSPDISLRRPPTWLQNAVASAIDERPAIAVVIDDLGVNRAGTAALNRLPAPLTLAFLPYATGLSEQTRAAHAAGHELLVHVPMEPRGPDWPGPDALTSQLGPTELISRLRTQLRSFGGFVGVNNHMGSRLTADPERMDLLMAELRQRGLLFLDSRTTPESVAARQARRLNVPYAERDVFLDNQLDLEAVLRQLALTERIASRRGYAVAMGHPHDVTIEALRRWLPTLDARGFALVPISAIVARRACAEGTLLIDACARYTAPVSLVQR